METDYFMIPVTVLELLSQNDSEYELSSNYDEIKNINMTQHYTNGNFSNNRFDSLAVEPDPIHYTIELKEIEGTNLGIESVVQILPEKWFGFIKWIGTDASRKNTLVGVELEELPMEENNLSITDGTYNGKRYFKCLDKRAIFVEPYKCVPDERFNEVAKPNKKYSNGRNFEKEVDPAKMFGYVDCPIIPGSVVPLKLFTLEELDKISGEFKGIQGHHNSCYLDATLFAMFTFTSVFDSLLFRPADNTDIESYEEVQTVLREEIVNPLRENLFVRADRVMNLRKLLEKLSSVTGLTSEEKDPEEFLNSLLAQIMRAEPFLKLNSGQDAFFYQLFMEKDERIKFPTVQELFEQSFLSSDIKLKEVPSCLIIQMPRFGKNYKMYSRILPSPVLDVTDIIEDSPRQCSVCGKLAQIECRDCFRSLQNGGGLENTAFCHNCSKIAHSHSKRENHNPRELSIPEDVKQMGDEMIPPRIFMELFAVVCIETSHYVSFVKAGPGQEAPWCFFDSMADRKGEQNGYNIPKLTSVPDLPTWLSDKGAKVLNEAATNDKMLPEHAKRVLCDAYMCMYQSTDVMMYQ